MPQRHNDSADVQNDRRRFLKAGGAGAVSLALAGCSGNGGGGSTDTPTDTPTPTDTGTPEPDTAKPGENIPTGGTLTYGMSAKPDSSSIYLSGSVYSAVGLDPVHVYGVSQDPVTYEYKPWLFSDWELKQKDSDKPVAHFKVREAALENMTFGNGDELTLEDIRFSYQYLIDQKPGEFSGFVDAVESISESSDENYDFQLQFTKKIVTWEGYVGGAPIVPKSRWTDDSGKQVNYKQWQPIQEHGNVVGLGPGVMTRFEPSTSMRVEFTNTDGWEVLSNLQWRKDHKQIIAGGPFIDAVNFKIFGSQSAMTQAFLNGGIDTHYGSMSTSSIPTVQDREGLTLVDGFDSGFSYWGYNLRRKPLDDATLRQAMGMAFDDIYWISRLQRGFSIKGDYAHSPGYRAARPETNFGGELLTDPATEVFTFRQSSPGIVDKEGLRTFLTEGTVVSGQGTYVGKEFPGTLSGVKASQDSAKYEYTFGPVQSQVLKEAGADKEIRVDGKTITEMMGGPITMFIDPPQKQPREAKAFEDWVSNLKEVGIPIKTQVLSFNTMVGRVYNKEEFDIYPMGWGGTNPYGTSLYFFFHSDNADVKGNSDSFVYNSTGYGIGENGYDKQLSEAYTSLDLKQATKKFARANERIYLDQPYHVMDYAKIKWPVNSQKWNGYIGGVVDPAFASWYVEWNNIHKRQ